MNKTCIAPNDIREGDLVAYLEGAASPAVIGHIARCPACAAEAAALREIDLLFTAVHARPECPDLDDLLQYQAGLLTRAEQRRIKRHVVSCEACQAELAALTISEPGPLPADRLRQTGRAILRALLAPASATPTFAVRGDERRWLEYRAGGYRIILGLVPPLAAEQIWQIEGQLLREDEALPALDGAAVQLLRDDAVVARDTVDDFGYFALERLAPGLYAIQVDLDQTSILIEDVKLA
jgi:anti-sigma factor RsiW